MSGAEARGASVTVWCGVIKLLAEKYPNRAAEAAGMNETIRLVAKLEAAYAGMPEVSKVAAKHGVKRRCRRTP